ncbi:MAG: hypothetical protein JWN80_146 [Microbacteriaceae bacterium]|jgi:hypothetical protein|nr:hypothetical protein [Microbacteriaceae bacterium]
MPADWLPVRRDDGELVGYLANDIPMTLVGQPLDHGTLEERGLIALDGRWQCRLPNPLPAGGIDASTPATDWDWRYVVIAETSPAECRVRLYMAYPEELRSWATLPVPVGELLRRES